MDQDNPTPQNFLQRLLRFVRKTTEGKAMGFVWGLSLLGVLTSEDLLFFLGFLAFETVVFLAIYKLIFDKKYIED
jgi:hypothetical protein